ncbi:hypothetical protein [Psittacicella hinzii]|nr:hypothetical protein [Psittacicella hinzii]
MSLSLVGISFGATAASPIYKSKTWSLSDEQLIELYKKTYKELSFLEEEFPRYLKDIREYNNGAELDELEFLELFSTTLLASLNQNFTLINNIYRSDPRIESLATLTDACLELDYRKLNHIIEGKLCTTVIFINYMTKYDWDILQSLTLLGTVTRVKFHPEEYSVSQKYLANYFSLKRIVRDLDLKFKFTIPKAGYLLNSPVKTDLEEVFNFKLVGSE